MKLSSTGGNISPEAPEQRVFLEVDWSRVTGAQTAVVTFTAKAEGQASMSVPVSFTANHTVPPGDFHGAFGNF